MPGPADITVYGRPNSSNTAKVLWALDELGLGWTLELRGTGYGGTDTDDFARMNPNRKVPVLKDGETILWESNAIIRYLAARYAPGSMWPTDPALRAKQDRWMDWSTLTLSPVAKKLMAAAGAGTPLGLEDITTAVDVLEVLDWGLDGAYFLGGTRPGMGDFTAGPWLFRMLRAAPELAKRVPSVHAYFKRLAAREGYATHVIRVL